MDFPKFNYIYLMVICDDCSIRGYLLMARVITYTPADILVGI